MRALRQGECRSPGIACSRSGAPPRTRAVSNSQTYRTLPRSDENHAASSQSGQHQAAQRRSVSSITTVAARPFRGALSEEAQQHQERTAHRACRLAGHHGKPPMQTHARASAHRQLPHPHARTAYARRREADRAVEPTAAPSRRCPSQDPRLRLVRRVAGFPRRLTRRRTLASRVPSPLASARTWNAWRRGRRSACTPVGGCFEVAETGGCR